MNSFGWTKMIGCNGASERPATDFYPTPADVTYALLDFLNIPKTTIIWEPAAGDGDMVDAIAQRGYSVIGTDIQTGDDFFATAPPEGTGMIITNPPFSEAEGFIRRSFELGLPFALLLKSQYWHAARRLPLFDEITPDYVLPLTWRPDFLAKTGKKGAPLMDVMWCVWLKHGTLGGTAIYRPLRRPCEC